MNGEAADVLTSEGAPTPTLRPLKRTSREHRGDRIFRVLIMAIVWVVLAIFAALFVVLINGAWPAMERFGPGFIVRSGWDPVHLDFGALPFIAGTIIVAVGAMVLAGSVGLLTAICVTELLPPWLQKPVAYMIELLAFIPSVVYGLFGLLVLAPLLQRTVEMWLLLHLGPRLEIFNGAPYGVGYLSAIVILAIMLVPLIVSLSREALLLVPTSLKEGAYALGARRWDVVWDINLPYARNGIIGAFVLALGRALGETMAVAMTIGGGFSLPKTIMDQGYTLASVIANEFNEVSSNIYLSALIYCGLILFVITVGVNILAYFTMRRLAGTRGFRA
jgi:phosphate transport system permease protein